MSNLAVVLIARNSRNRLRKIVLGSYYRGGCAIFGVFLCLRLVSVDADAEQLQVDAKKFKI